MLLSAAPFVRRAVRAARNVPEWDADVLNSPAGGARYGGDWCDVFAVSGNSVAVTIGDVAGHGEPVAETMHAMRQAVFAATKDSADPSTILSVANNAAYAQGDGVIVTAIVAILNRGLQTLTFANAGHPAPLMMTSAAHGFLGHAVGDLPLGVVRKHRAADYVIALPPDALIVMYTDGVTEHDRNILCGERELVDACRAAYDAPGSDAARAIAQGVFGKTRGHDDAAVIALRASKG